MKDAADADANPPPAKRARLAPDERRLAILDLRQRRLQVNAEIDRLEREGAQIDERLAHYLAERIDLYGVREPPATAVTNITGGGTNGEMLKIFSMRQSQGDVPGGSVACMANALVACDGLLRMHVNTMDLNATMQLGVRVMAEWRKLYPLKDMPAADELLFTLRTKYGEENVPFELGPSFWGWTSKGRAQAPGDFTGPQTSFDALARDMAKDAPRAALVTMQGQTGALVALSPTEMWWCDTHARAPDGLGGSSASLHNLNALAGVMVRASDAPTMAVFLYRLAASLQCTSETVFEAVKLNVVQ